LNILVRVRCEIGFPCEIQATQLPNQILSDKSENRVGLVAQGVVYRTLRLIQQGGHKKGHVLGIARTGAKIALLTIYDLCKAVDRGMVISTRLPGSL